MWRARNGALVPTLAPALLHTVLSVSTLSMPGWLQSHVNGKTVVDWLQVTPGPSLQTTKKSGAAYKPSAFLPCSYLSYPLLGQLMIPTILLSLGSLPPPFHRFLQFPLFGSFFLFQGCLCLIPLPTTTKSPEWTMAWL